MKRLVYLSVGLALSISALLTLNVDEAAAASGKIIFPVLGSSSYTNDYEAPRFNGPHHATDIIAKKGQAVVSATDGTVHYVEYPQAGSQGYMVIIRSSAGNYLYYIHLDNDTPGTDDGRGGGMKAYAPDMKAGNPIKKGQLLGWVGDSGNAESTVPHLHFEIRRGSTSGEAINPYHMLKNDSVRISRPIHHPQLPSEILPFSAAYKRTLNVARSDVTGDGIEDVIVGADGTGSTPRVHVYNPSTKRQLAGFHVLSSRLKNGVDVAAGDVNGDGRSELVAAIKGKYDAKVAIYTYDATTQRFLLLRDFVVYEDATNVPKVTVGDMDGDGTDEIITGTGAGAASSVRVFDADGTLRKSFRPFLASFTGGVDVAAGNVSGTANVDELIIAPLTKGSSRTIVFNANHPGNTVTRQNEFYAYGTSYRGGIRLSVGEMSGQNVGFEIATMPNNKGGRAVLKANTASGRELYSHIELEEWWRGYNDVAASRNGSYEYSLATGGNRRGSIR